MSGPDTGPRTGPEVGEVLFEYTHVGGTVRVTAVDAATGTEVTIQAPAAMSPLDMQILAMKKLNYVMGKGKKT